MDPFGSPQFGQPQPVVVAVDASGRGFLYHAVALWHLVIPSNPILALFQLNIAGFGAVNGHIGFEKLELAEDTPIPPW
jgi:sterol desaturase/sphingolipid hydroxylase (fatty acid hydroxylase superfamily)